MRALVATVAALAAALLGTAAPATAGPVATPSRPAGVYVQGNRLVNAKGNALVLRGVNHSGSEYACSEGWGIFDGPVDNASIDAMQTWNVHVVRIPLNEDCWLAINGVKTAYAGSNYRTAIHGYVHRLEAHGMDVVLDLHWNAPGSTLASGQQVMPDAAHSPAFWKSVAEAYKSDHRVLFELYNEPHDVSWSCWKNGCTTSDGWKAVGMQGLVDVVRKTGATNVVLVGGLGWSSDLSKWLKWRPSDSAHALAAVFHAYNFGGCTTKSCWNSTVGAVAAKVPVVATEFGENDCAGGYVRPLMTWFDNHHVSYLGWTWNTWDCKSGPALVSDTSGTPTAFGRAVRKHFRNFG
jgi:endoglucanase